MRYQQQRTAALPCAAMVAGGMLLLAAQPPVPAQSAAGTPPTTQREKRHLPASALSLPLRFERNVGQATAPYDFVAHSQGLGLGLSRDGMRFHLARFSKTSAHGAGSRSARSLDARVNLLFKHSEATGHGTALERMPGVVSYFHGKSPQQWRTGVETYGRVLYTGLYPGVDVAYYSRGSRLEYDLLVRPHTRTDQIRLAVTGADRLALDPAGDLLLYTSAGVVRQPRPVAYQEVGGNRRPVAAAYRVQGNEVTFALGAYDASRELVIDPVLSYASLLHGTGSDGATAVAVDNQGNVYVAGTTTSPDLPTTTQPQPKPAGASEVFVAKLDASGKTLLYSAYLGGSGADSAAGIAVDPLGNAVVVGTTASSDFPVAPASRPEGGEISGLQDAFVVKLSATGAAELFARYLGGTGQDFATGVALDNDANVLVSGFTNSADLPAQTGQKTTLSGQTDGFLARLSPAAANVEYLTYIGGVGADYATGVAVDDQGSAYVVATVDGSRVSGGTRVGPGGGQDVLLVKIPFTAGTNSYQVVIGGHFDEEARGVAVDRDYNACVVGTTSSSDFPTLSPLPGSRAGTDANVFLTRVNSQGAPTFSTYLGGSGADFGNAVAVDAAGNMYVAGKTASADFPTQNALHGAVGGTDAFVLKVFANPPTLDYASYLGGAGYDEALAIAVDAGGDAYVAGVTSSAPFEGSATNVGGSTAISGTAAFVVRVPRLQPGPAAPSTLTAQSATDTAVTLSWTDLSTNETGFEVERSPASSTPTFSRIATVGAGITQYVDTTVTPGTAYMYRVRAINPALGPSDYSNSVTIRTGSAVVPDSLAVEQFGPHSVQLVWEFAGTGQTGFVIERNPDLNSAAGFGVVAQVGPTVRNFIDDTVHPGTLYTYQVRAISTNNLTSSPSNTASISVSPQTGRLITVSPGKLSFESTLKTDQTAKPKSKSLVIRNQSTVPVDLQFTLLDPQVQFTVNDGTVTSGPLGTASLQPGAVLPLKVTFGTAKKGTFSAALQIRATSTDKLLTDQQQVTLKGVTHPQRSKSKSPTPQ